MTDGIKTYWDLSEIERGLLDHEDLERYEQIELMVAGVAAPQPPTTGEPPARPSMEGAESIAVIEYKDPRYSWRSSVTLPLAFESSDVARAFMTQPGVRILFDSEQRSVAPLASLEPEIVVRDALTLEEARLRNAEFCAYRRQRDDRDAAMRTYEEAQRKVNGLLESMRDDRARCAGYVLKLAQAAVDFHHYYHLAEENGDVAVRFLLKRYTAAELVDSAVIAELQDVRLHDEFAQAVERSPEVSAYKERTTAETELAADQVVASNHEDRAGEEIAF